MAFLADAVCPCHYLELLSSTSHAQIDLSRQIVVIMAGTVPVTCQEVLVAFAEAPGGAGAPSLRIG